MLLTSIFKVFICGFFVSIVNAADSDGKEFVFSFNYDTYQTLSPAATTSVVVIPSYNDSVCTFTYSQNSNFAIVQFQKTAVYGATNEFSFNVNEVLLRFTYLIDKMYVEKNSDFRIFASCTEEVKLIGKLADPVNAWGDYFLIPSSKNAGTQYTFAFPTADYYAKGAFAILPVNKEGSINVTFVGYAMGELFHSETFEYEIIPGHFQHYISCNIFESANLFDYNVSVSIITSSPVMLSFESPLTTLSNDDSSCGQSCNEDSVNFMPIASQPIVCDKPLVTPDQRMITNDFTTRLYVSPPSVETNCDASDTITVYDVINNVQGTKQEVSKFGFTAISLMNTEAAGFTTTSGQMSTNRFGSFFGASDHTTAFGNFMHYVPSISEWITGKSQFYTLAKNCYVELYTDSNEDAIIKIDGIEIDGYIFKEQNIQLFGKNYIQYVVDMYKYGIHTIENSGNYVAYVICSNVNGPNNAAGYLTGFNQRK